MLGFDPLYVANEGVLLAFVAESCADEAVKSLRAHPLGRGATRIGRCVTGQGVHLSAGGRLVEVPPGFDHFASR